MGRSALHEAVALLEKANAGLMPESLSKVDAERLLRSYARIEQLAAFGKAALAARVGDATRLARVTGTSVGRARRAIETGRRMAAEPRLARAVQSAEVSLEQADEIARTTAVAPDALDDLLGTARSSSFQVLKDRARTIRLDAAVNAGLADRQHQARTLRHWVGELGMVHIQAALEPHIGTPIVNRLEAEARRLFRAAGRDDHEEPFERHLADALPVIVTGERTGASRAELVVLVGHGVARRGWRDVHPGEHCKIPGVGPIAPQVAHEIAQDAFLTGLFYDGTDLRHLKRWTRTIPTPIRVALQLGDPPDFDGPRCVDCGNRYRLELDHRRPYADGGPTSLPNTDPRCHPCHVRKTARDRAAAQPQAP